MNWNLNIEKVNNGYIVKHKSDNDDDYTVTSIFEEFDNDFMTDEHKIEFETAERMLWYILEYFGVNNSKHYNYGINVEVEDRTKEE